MSASLRGLFLMDDDTKRYVRHLKTGRTSVISDVCLRSCLKISTYSLFSTFCGCEYVRLDVIQNIDTNVTYCYPVVVCLLRFGS